MKSGTLPGLRWWSVFVPVSLLALTLACDTDSTSSGGADDEATIVEEANMLEDPPNDLALALYAVPDEARLVVTVEGSQINDAKVALGRVVVRSMSEIHHPAAEPDFPEPFASFASDIECTDEQCSVWFDMADADAYAEDRVMERLVEIALRELVAVGIDPGALSTGR